MHLSSSSSPGYTRVSFPTLATFDTLEKYLERIDESHWYTNFGQLNTDFETRLENLFGKRIQVVTTSSGTSALIAAIYAVAGRALDQAPICVLPAYTFVGTICAVIACGYQPLLFDVDLDTWDLDIERLTKIPEFRRIGLVVPVAIYGRLVDLNKWEHFSNNYNVHVVVDAAASFDLFSEEYFEDLDRLILTVSLHATKAFAIGEGGLVITRNSTYKEATIRAINFGFYGSRQSIGPSINGKMSEYQAAIGLANLDLWRDRLDALQGVRSMYLKHANQTGISTRILCGGSTSLAYCFYVLDQRASAKSFFESLLSHQIDYRLWYEKGLHMQPNFMTVMKYPLPNTHILSNSLVGLPMHSSLEIEDVEWITKSIEEWEGMQ